VWESSHLGGDRFAGNLVCLPHGLYFGHVGPDEAAGVVAAYRAGDIALEWYRGRSCYPMPVQAAEALARRELGLRSIDDLVPSARRRLAPGEVEVTLAAPDGRTWQARVRSSADPTPRPLTCRSGSATPPTYDLVSLTPA
jgi:hypothetical protein